MKIYFLKLEEDKYYIGKTKNIIFRLEDHFESGQGSKWTTLYKPVDVLGIVTSYDKFDEDRYTLKYMVKYGIENVRGGSFCSVVLSNSDINTIRKMIKSSADLCYNCGKPGHYASKCPKKFIKCLRCSRTGHKTSDCFAKRDIYGRWLRRKNTSVGGFLNKLVNKLSKYY